MDLLRLGFLAQSSIWVFFNTCFDVFATLNQTGGPFSLDNLLWQSMTVVIVLHFSLSRPGLS